MTRGIDLFCVYRRLAFTAAFLRKEQTRVEIGKSHKNIPINVYYY